MDQQTRGDRSLTETTKCLTFIDNFRADKPETKGDPILPPDLLKDIVQKADAEGIDCHFHSFGDGAVRLTLDAIENAIKSNVPRDRRHTIAHAIYVDRADVPRFAQLGVIAQFSIQWATPDATIMNISKARVGEKVLFSKYHLARSIADAGGRVTFGTDWPAAGHYSTYKPLEAIQVAVTRQELDKPDGPVMPPKNERMSLKQAIQAATINAAYQLRLEHKVGSIEAGKLADLIILDRNLFDVPSHEIQNAKVLLTMMNGNVRHRDGI